ncbi:MAG: hypothetical protein IJH51_04955 [Christensenellaceae bacterium]|nr:hypothetical protein [Christensenellaceae bacterium]
MKKSLSLILVAVLIFTALFAFADMALAADVSWSASFSPSELTGGGTVTFSTSVQNNSANPVTGVTLYYPDGSEIVLSESLAAGESTSRVDENFAIAEDQLGKAQEFKLIYITSDSVKHTLTGSATVKQKTGSVDVSGSTSANITEVNAAGDKVTFTFNFKNTGDVAMSNCRLYAPPINEGNELTQNAFTLEPGATKTLTYKTPVNQAMTVAPKLTFDAGGTNNTFTTNTVAVSIKGAAPADTPAEETPQDQPAEETPAEEPSADEEAGTSSLEIFSTSVDNEEGGKDYTITVTNTGETGITDLVVTDSLGNNIILSETALAPGQKATGSYSYYETSDDITFKVTGKDALGNDVEASSAAAAADESGTKKGLYIDVVAANYELKEPGEASFNITVSNTSDYVLKDVTVSEESLGDIFTIPTMGTDVKTYEHKVNVEETKSFTFTVRATMEDGTEVSATTNPITINVQGGGIDMWMILLIIIIAAVAAIVAILLVMNNNKKKAAAARRNRGGYQNARRDPRQGSGARRPQGGYYDDRRPRQGQPVRRPQRSGEPVRRPSQSQNPQRTARRQPQEIELDRDFFSEDSGRQNGYDLSVGGQDEPDVRIDRPQRARRPETRRPELDIDDSLKIKKHYGDRNNF